MNQLITRLENAPEGSRELDRLIWTVGLGNTIKTVIEIGGHQHERWIETDGTRWKAEATKFSTSLDAAVQLVPAEFAWSVQSSGQFPGQAWLYPPDNTADIQYQADGATPALALCGACLKAWASIAQPQEIR